MLPRWREPVRVWGLSRALPTRRRVTLSVADPTSPAKGYAAWFSIGQATQGKRIENSVSATLRFERRLSPQRSGKREAQAPPSHAQLASPIVPRGADTFLSNRVVILSLVPWIGALTRRPDNIGARDGRCDTVDAGDSGGKDSHRPHRSKRLRYFSQGGR